MPEDYVDKVLNLPPKEEVEKAYLLYK